MAAARESTTSPTLCLTLLSNLNIRYHGTSDQQRERINVYFAEVSTNCSILQLQIST